MRDILFKAKRIDNGEWVYGNYAFTDTNGEQHFIFQNKAFEHEVDKDTICQFTRLTDKNGNKIWENDILSISKKMDSLGTYYFPAVKYPVNVSVKWDLCAWMWETIAENKHYISFPDAWCHYEAEVIGNAFDNPELLKGE